jgi:hypothetical protein
MTQSELFDIWAPPGAVWSKWAKPVLFAELTAVSKADPTSEPLPSVELRVAPTAALILDLPGADSVKTALTLLESGFRPVPVFNGSRGPRVLDIKASAVIDNDPIVAWLVGGADFLLQHALPDVAPPAFLLDSRRRREVSVNPGRFDNRWLVFPQDFPSANFVKAQGITEVVLLQEESQLQPQEDLAHVLRRYQEAGLPLFVTSLQAAGAVQPLYVARPPRFRSLWYGALAVLGLRRNSAGGFGSIVPEPSGG